MTTKIPQVNTGVKVMAQQKTEWLELNEWQVAIIESAVMKLNLGHDVPGIETLRQVLTTTKRIKVSA